MAVTITAAELATRIQGAASESVADAEAGLLGRAIASATVQPATEVMRALSPDRLMMAGRALIRRGELVYLIRATRTGWIPVPAETLQVFGGDDPRSWQYVVTLTGPSNSRTVRVSAAMAVHFR